MFLKRVALACLGIFALSSVPAKALDAFYLGGQVGHVGLLGDLNSRYSNTIGFGVDLGVRTNPLLDILFSFQRSAHSGTPNGLTLYSTFLSADFHFFEFNDFDFAIGAGPGFYFFKVDPTTDSRFGLHAGTSVDVIVAEHVRVGLGFRFHGVFNSTGTGNYWTAMMRLGYLFSSK